MAWCSVDVGVDVDVDVGVGWCRVGVGGVGVDVDVDVDVLCCVVVWCGVVCAAIGYGYAGSKKTPQRHATRIQRAYDHSVPRRVVLSIGESRCGPPEAHGGAA